jgi:hypothetical protein
VWADLIRRATICGSVVKELAAAADSEGHGKWTETKRCLASVKLRGRRTKCNLRGEKRKEGHFIEMTSKISMRRSGVCFFVCSVSDVRH